MDVLINELSLTGQYNTVLEFIETGALKKFNLLLNEMRYLEADLYKNNEFYASLITKDISIYNFFTAPISREYDEIRKMKSSLSYLFKEPYWENNQRHSSDTYYLFNNTCVTGKSLAEACERDKIIVSFLHQDFSDNFISILKENNEIILDNLFNEDDYINLAWNRRDINCETYCKLKFNNTKLDFSKIEQDESFCLLNENDELLFIDGFRKFSELSWQQITEDDGLKYKNYNDRKKFFKKYNKEIKKFRISELYRCFGYAEQGKFYVLLFDLEHKYSDFG